MSFYYIFYQLCIYVRSVRPKFLSLVCNRRAKFLCANQSEEASPGRPRRGEGGVSISLLPFSGAGSASARLGRTCVRVEYGKCVNVWTPTGGHLM